MTTNPSSTNSSGSATIYQFPLRGRFAPDYRSASQSVRPVSLQVVHVESGGGWYHQEAIDAERPRRN